MWVLNNKTPFGARRIWVRDLDGASVSIVAVKATFLIEPDGTQILQEEQEEVSSVSEFSGDPERSSLLVESDLEYTKNRTDVLLHGHAYSPGGEPASSVDVSLKVANVDKTLRVVGDRVIKGGLLGMGMQLSAPEPFLKVPITYERAFGGTDQKDADPKKHGYEPRNPAGVGFATKKEYVVGTPAPNIEDPKQPYKSWQKGTPVGFGPIARHWSPRIERAGTYDAKWEKSRFPLLPSDFDELFYQCAPEDQQVPSFLKGGETVELSNLTPEGRLSFPLPRVTFGIDSFFYDGTREIHRADLHTLKIEPDKRRFQMVWHSKLPCHHKEQKLKETRIMVKDRVASMSSPAPAGVWTGA